MSFLDRYLFEARGTVGCRRRFDLCDVCEVRVGEDSGLSIDADLFCS